ncbi:MAG: hypothetical protein LBV33_06000, partial [Lachnospiraceae bacterium]|nr:hypothetical protein [Lachnospiraceae bacterium]
MPKQFPEVFPTLKLDKKLTDLFSEVSVTKVTTTKQKDFIRIYIDAQRLIHKGAVFQVEEAIKKQLFPYHDLTIKIYERYHLSAQYNPEKFFHIYRDSIALELGAYSPVLHN